MRNRSPPRNLPTLLLLRRRQRVSKLLKRRVLGGHREDVDDRDFVMFINPCMPYFYAIIRAIYILSLKSPWQ